MRLKILIPVFTALALGACGHTAKKEPTPERIVASEAPRKIIQVPIQSCTEAYQAAYKSPSIPVIQNATEICLQASQATCFSSVENSGSDVRETSAALCELKAAYGANKTVNQGQASFRCDSAYRAAMQTSIAEELRQASELCSQEAESSCDEKVRNEDGTIDRGSWAYASCQLLSAHGSYKSVSRRK